MTTNDKPTVAEIQSKLKHLQERGLGASVALRLAVSSPYHPVRLGRLLFTILAVLSALFTVACLAAPLALQGELLRWLQQLDQAAPIGLPAAGALVLLLSCIIIMTLVRTEKIIGRDYPLLPEEQAQYDIWVAELRSLTIEPVDQSEKTLTPRPAPPRRKRVVPEILQTPFGPPAGPLHATEDDLSMDAKAKKLAGVEENWLAQTLQAAQKLEAHYPIQVTLDYSMGRNIPFSLTIERATSGVINQAILDFIQFLGSIPTPNKAIISLRHMPHIDQHFSMTVVTAMDAHCPAPADVNQIDSEIHIHFVSPDSCWKRYPFLPTHLL